MYEWMYGEQEERDFEPATDAHNCYREARLAFAEQRNDKVAIKKLTELGRYLIVGESHFHCRATDAFVGTIHLIYGSYKSEEEALIVMRSRELTPYNGEYGYFIAQPTPLEKPEPLVPEFDDGVPF